MEFLFFIFQSKMEIMVFFFCQLTFVFGSRIYQFDCIGWRKANQVANLHNCQPAMPSTQNDDLSGYNLAGLRKK